MAKSSHKNKPTQPLATVLTITLNADGTGSLVAKRGDLAAVNQFTYREMKDIIAAIQRGAAHLVAVEQNPPPKDLTTVAATPSSSSATTLQADSAQPSEDEGEVDTAPGTSDGEADEAQPASDDDENIDARLAGVSVELPTTQLSLL
jgi:hypothetical protein